MTSSRLGLAARLRLVAPLLIFSAIMLGIGAAAVPTAVSHVVRGLLSPRQDPGLLTVVLLLVYAIVTLCALSATVRAFRRGWLPTRRDAIATLGSGPTIRARDVAGAAVTDSAGETVAEVVGAVIESALSSIVP